MLSSQDPQLTSAKTPFLSKETDSRDQDVDIAFGDHLWGFPSGSAGNIHLSMQEMQEVRGRSLWWKDLLEEEMATHCSILAWERGAWLPVVRGVTKSWARQND